MQSAPQTSHFPPFRTGYILEGNGMMAGFPGSVYVRSELRLSQFSNMQPVGQHGTRPEGGLSSRLSRSFPRICGDCRGIRRVQFRRKETSPHHSSPRKEPRRYQVVEPLLVHPGHPLYSHLPPCRCCQHQTALEMCSTSLTAARQPSISTLEDARPRECRAVCIDVPQTDMINHESIDR